MTLLPRLVAYSVLSGIQQYFNEFVNATKAFVQMAFALPEKANEI